MEVNDFSAIRISLASPEKIREWSHGEVLKPETINYRTLRPERDGLFCERIFGPTKDWECYCGKYKRVRFKGIVCEKCGVEVAPSRVRRERMGHIELASPVAHIWYVKGVPSRLGLLLNISPRNLERILYFAQYVVTHVDEEARQRTLQRHERELAMRIARIEGEINAQIEQIEVRRDEALAALDEEEKAQLRSLEDRLATETDEIIGAARALQSQLERMQGQELREPITLPWMDEPLFDVGERLGREHFDRLNEVTQARLSQIEDAVRAEQENVRLLMQARRDQVRREADVEIERLRTQLEEQKNELRQQHEADLIELRSLQPMDLITEGRYRELTERWGNVFKAGMGAEAIREVLSRLDLDKLAKELRHEIRTTRSKQRRKKAAKRLRVVEAFRKSGNKPEWMILTVLPVIPPDLRPMVQLDGGRFATSDLNDLYRRVINRNNRLKRLLDLGAPDVIVRNEKRMLQEAVDSLIDNGRRGRAVSRSGKRKLKSLSDLLKGKQGRFRRNLLGKRVDYSGRSVIVVGPELQLHQCGLPKKMALELFKPFVMRRLVEQNYAHNIKSAKRMVDREDPAVWDVLEEVTKERPVLLNRAPTLHRLGIQAFEVVLIEGSAIQIHPLVCAAFNADFDGDQMAVHVPLSDKAVEEARRYMLSTKNLLKPASGEPIVGPTKDMVLGCYYMTLERPGAKGSGKAFSDFDEVRMAYDLGLVHIQAPIKVFYRSWLDETPLDYLPLSERVKGVLAAAGFQNLGQLIARVRQGRREMLALPGFGPAAWEELLRVLEQRGINPQTVQLSGVIDTTVGRVLFNMSLPRELQYVNRTMDKKALNDVVAECYQRLGPERTAELVDEIKRIGFHYATRSGMTIAISDISVPASKERILEEAAKQVEETERQFRRGLITEEEQYNKVVEIWQRATDEITEEVKRLFSPLDGLGAMATSGATKGGIQPIRQLAGIRGLMADPSGRIIPLPIRSNFREGLTALEYFLSTHGARKGLADTALRTADAGYLTRRLVDVAQDVMITMEDCGTNAGIWIDRQSTIPIGESFGERIIGRVAAAPITDPRTGEVIVERGQLIEKPEVTLIDAAKVERVYVRSPLSCEAPHGLCRMCYGADLARGGLVSLGEAVGIIAAQSIGEPGTQLTLRTFHTGGVAGAEDITQGLPRVEELFEARVPKGEAVIAEIDGVVDVYWEGELRKLKISNTRLVRHELTIPVGWTVVVENGDRVQADTVVARGPDGTEEALLAGTDGQIFFENGPDGAVSAVIRREETEEWEREIPPSARLRVSKGDRVKAGEQLTEGAKNPREVLRIQGREVCQLYLLEEVQKVYRSQGVNIHDKYIEIIIRQMLRKVRVRSTGDTDFLPGELVDRFMFEAVNAEIIRRGGTPARGETVLLGVTKAALNTDSFLAAASFQETTRVLTEAAVKGAVDELRGLKENVIIGKLIPVGTGFEERMRKMAEASQRGGTPAREEARTLIGRGLVDTGTGLDDEDFSFDSEGEEPFADLESDMDLDADADAEATDMYGMYDTEAEDEDFDYEEQDTDFEIEI
ncbi:MAG: DNA-directed RNA polymerase subunit beta' [Anaerolineae bacterium]|nr:DNA-directed RNA polymerase subunit beta' [Anaerolineae bacterium]MDW8099197.1 DNA-directed RNA polymerase subunit beta' [Anaerolineae bacterium]